MSRFSKLMALAAVGLAAVSCGRSAKIDAVIADAPSSEVVVKLLDINRFEVLDTVALDASGHFTYKVDVVKGQPEFVYLFHNDKKVASLVLQGGDKVSIEADTLGNYTVAGSEESLKLAEVERDYAAALSRMTSLARRIEDAINPDYALSLRNELGKEYIDYYRDRVKYVIENSTSLSVVPVFFQILGSDLPLFAQTTDAIHFRNAADSLSLVYPESRYVKVLRQEADKRFGYLQLETRIQTAEEIGFPDIELPDVNGEKQKLSEVDSKVVLVYFWSASEAAQSMFNLDVLKPIYDDLHAKGLDIYQVSLDVDKGLWAKVVKEQKMPWVNVCDSRGAASPYAAVYNVTSLPVVYVIKDGELNTVEVSKDKNFRRSIEKLLR